MALESRVKKAEAALKSAQSEAQRHKTAAVQAGKRAVSAQALLEKAESRLA